MQRINKNRPVCFICNDILDICVDINKLLINPDKNRRKITKEILKLTAHAKDIKCHGKSMEKRLLDYRFTIESLGFIRKGGKSDKRG